MSFLSNLLGALQVNSPNRATPSSDVFETDLSCFPVAVIDKFHLEHGDRIFLPPSAFEALIKMEISYPMMFKLTNPVNKKELHCGVVEFSADEGTTYIPYWMMEQMGIADGAGVKVTNVTLPKGTFVQFQPDKYTFAQLSNPRVVLERTLRNYATLSKGSVIRVPYLDEVFLLEVVELRPASAVTIIETDMQVDFAPPKNVAEYEAVVERERRAKMLEEQFKADPAPAVAPVVAAALPAGDNIFAPAASEEKSYFSRLSGGHTLSKGNTTSSSSSSSSSFSASTKPTPAQPQPGRRLGGETTQSTMPSTGGYSLRGPARPQSSLLSKFPPKTDQSKPSNMLTREVIGNWVYFKDSDGKLVKREPVSSQTSSMPSGPGHVLKK